MRDDTYVERLISIVTHITRMARKPYKAIAGKKMEKKGDIRISAKTDDRIVVPLTDFLDVISDKTGWSHHALLHEKDIGQIETKLKIKAKKPSQLKTTKRGKSTNTLYKFLTPEARKWNRDLTTTLIGR